MTVPGPGLPPDKLREMAFAMLDLADGLEAANAAEAEEDGPARRPRGFGPSIDHLAPLLASIARIEYRARGSRAELFDEELFGEPAWDMLLDLFVQTVEGRKISVTSLCIASRVPSTTALRYINELEKRGMIVREKSQVDQRTSFLRLSRDTFVKLGAYLRQRSSAFGFSQRQDALLQADNQVSAFAGIG